MFSYAKNWWYGSPKKLEEIDLNSEKYTGDSRQRNIITAKTEEYEASLNRLRNLYITGGAASIVPLMLAGTFWGVVTDAAVLLLLYVKDDLFNSFKLKDATNSCKEKHKELLSIYQWMVKSGPKATHDPAVIDLLKKIAPNTAHRKDIFPQSFIDKPDEISDKFFDALKNTAIEFDPLMRQIIQRKSKESKTVEDTKKNITIIPGLFEVNTPHFFKSTPFKQIKANANVLLFGYDSEAEKAETPIIIMQKKMI